MEEEEEALDYTMPVVRIDLSDDITRILAHENLNRFEDVLNSA